METFSPEEAARRVMGTRATATREPGANMVLGPGTVDATATTALRRAKLRARSAGDLNGAMLSAGFYAKKQDKLMFVYAGNSYGYLIWRVSYKQSDFLNPVAGSRKLEELEDKIAAAEEEREENLQARDKLMRVR